MTNQLDPSELYTVAGHSGALLGFSFNGSEECDVADTTIIAGSIGGLHALALISTAAGLHLNSLVHVTRTTLDESHHIAF